MLVRLSGSKGVIGLSPNTDSCDFIYLDSDALLATWAIQDGPLYTKYFIPIKSQSITL